MTPVEGHNSSLNPLFITVLMKKVHKYAIGLKHIISWTASDESSVIWTEAPPLPFPPSVVFNRPFGFFFKPQFTYLDIKVVALFILQRFVLTHVYGCITFIWKIFTLQKYSLSTFENFRATIIIKI